MKSIKLISSLITFKITVLRKICSKMSTLTKKRIYKYKIFIKNRKDHKTMKNYKTVFNKIIRRKTYNLTKRYWNIRIVLLKNPKIGFKWIYLKS